MIRVVLPFHLQQLANTGREVELQVDEPVTQRSILDALEARYPVLRETVRDQATLERRAFIRFLPAGRISLSNRRMPRCLSRLPAAKSGS
jgi:hypothetical protein